MATVSALVIRRIFNHIETDAAAAFPDFLEHHGDGCDGCYDNCGWLVMGKRVVDMLVAWVDG